MTLRVGVIGTGTIGKTHIHRLTYTLTGAEVVAVNDVNEAQAQAAVDSEQIDAFNTEFQEWIDSTVNGDMLGPSAWDGYVVAVSADASVQAKHENRIVPIEIPERPAFYR